MLKFVVVFLLLLCSFKLICHEFIIGINERDIYRYKNEQGEWAGKDIELIKAIFRRTPFEYRLVSMPWARVVKQLEVGAIDMTVAATAFPERKKFALFTKNNFRYSHHMLFASKNKLHLFDSVKELSDLANTDVIVAALRGAIFYESYPELLENQEFASKIVYISDDQNMSNFVLKGRADGYIDSETEGKHYLSSQPAYRENIIPLFRITSDDEAGSKIMFSKARITPEQVDIFDIALKDLHDSGEYEQISKLY